MSNIEEKQYACNKYNLLLSVTHYIMIPVCIYKRSEQASVKMVMFEKSKYETLNFVPPIMAQLSCVW